MSHDLITPECNAQRYRYQRARQPPDRGLRGRLNSRPVSELLLNVHDYARAARARLPGDVFDYYEGGALDEISLRENEAAWGRLELVDGGVRRGSDVVKALALGARAVLLGRPVLWGLAVAGEEGARAVLEILRRELDEAMLLCGCATIEDIDGSLLEPG